MPAAPLDLDRPRGFSEILRESGRLFRRHFVLFPGLTLAVSVPASVVLDGVWGGLLDDGSQAAFRWEPAAVWWFVLSPLIVALHVRIVQQLGEGVAPAPWHALRQTAGFAPVVVAAFALFSVALVAGLALLVIPGVYLGALLAFCTDTAVAERLGPVDALRSSARLVRGRWWRCFGYLLGAIVVLGILPGIAAELASQALEERAGAAAYFAVMTVVYALLASLLALFEALLYFDLRHRQATDG